MRGGFNSVSQEGLRELQLSVKDLGHQLVTEHQTSPIFEEDEAPHTNIQIYKYTNIQIHDGDYREF